MNDLKFTNAGDFLRSQQKRIGFACKYLHYNQNQKPKLLEEIQRPYTEKCTTVAWLNRQTKDVAALYLWDIMVHIFMNMDHCFPKSREIRSSLAAKLDHTMIPMELVFMDLQMVMVNLCIFLAYSLMSKENRSRLSMHQDSSSMSL